MAVVDRSFCTYFLLSVLVFTNFITLAALFYQEWWSPPLDEASASASALGLRANGNGTSEEVSWSSSSSLSLASASASPSNEIKVPEVEHPKDTLKLPKVAICIVGALRTFFHPKVRELMKANFLDAVVTRPEDRQIFFDVTISSHCTARPRDQSEFSNCQKFSDRVASRENFIKIIESDPAFNGSLYQFNEDFDCKHPFLKQEPCCASNVHVDSAAREGYVAYQRKRHCYEWVLEYEAAQRKGNKSNEEDFRFDWFIIARPDLAFLDMVPLIADLERRSPRVYAISKEGGQPISDFFYIVPRALAADFLHAIRTLYDLECKRSHHFDWPPEFHLHPYWDTLPIPRQVLPISMSIIREVGNSDCWRLGNEVNHNGRPFLVDGKAISPIDYCNHLVTKLKAFDPNLIPEYRVSLTLS